MEPTVPLKMVEITPFSWIIMLCKGIFTFVIEKLDLRNTVNKCNALNKIVSQPIGLKFLFSSL